MLSIAEIDGILGKRIGEQWHKPAGVAGNVEVEIHINMARDGKLDKMSITRSSGNQMFDRTALAALKSIGVVKEVAQLDDATFEKAYRSRSIVLN
ncbi:Gram-negative bacterial tonB protein [compost metagenome]